MIFLIHATTFPLPAGLIGTSPWLDLTHSFLSARNNPGYDYLPNPWEGIINPKPSAVWPSAEPRYHFYTNLPLHPLVLFPICKSDGIGFSSFGRDRVASMSAYFHRRRRH